MLNLDEELMDLLIEGQDDWVPIDRVINAAKRRHESGGGPVPDAVREVLAVIFEAGLMEPGDLADEGFVAWPGSVEEWISRILRECEAFDWLPQGAGCWLSNTPLGDRAAEQWAGRVR